MTVGAVHYHRLYYVSAGLFFCSVIIWTTPASVRCVDVDCYRYRSLDQ